MDPNHIIQAHAQSGPQRDPGPVGRAGGSPRLTLRTRVAGNVGVGGRRHRLVATIQFEDNGPGVAPEIRDTIFYPLVSGRTDGTGLGLGIAQDLVSRHGGLIEFDSAPGRTYSRDLSSAWTVRMNCEAASGLVGRRRRLHPLGARKGAEGRRHVRQVPSIRPTTRSRRCAADAPDVLMTDIRMPGAAAWICSRTSRHRGPACR